MVRKKTQRLSQSEAGAECVPQLLCCSPAPGNASDVGLSHRHTRPYCWYIQHMTDPVALSHEITRVHVTKVTYNESCSPPFSVSLFFCCNTWQLHPQVCATSALLSSLLLCQMLGHTRTTAACTTLFLPSVVKGFVCE